jgi:hypothetical protein
MGLAATAGYIKQRLDNLDKTANGRIDSLINKIDEQDERTRQFWQEKWPLVERHEERISTLEEETYEIRQGLHGLEQVVHRHIGNKP